MLESVYANEIAWQVSRNPKQVDESEFLREAAWVVYCSGFRESTVRRHFDYISLCFFDWGSAKEIVAAKDVCVDSAMRAIGNYRKHLAIVTIAQRVAERSFVTFKRAFLKEPIAIFATLPFLGPVTSVHLAKNLGFDLAKPDRHLVRLRTLLGFQDVEEMCRSISSSSGDSVRVVDLVLWRYMERGAKAHRRPLAG